VDRGLDGCCVLDVQGVGYEVFVPVRTASALPPPPAPVTLHIHTHVREEALTLFGFGSMDDRRAFRAMLDVKNVGPKLAIGILGDLSAAQLAAAVSSEDAKRLGTISGVGKKTAERLVLELKEKLPKLLTSPGELPAPQPAQVAGASEGAGADLVGALVNLGFGRPAAEAAVAQVIEPDDERAFETLLRLALSKLA
jgi:Holliday junction DNA helicase RuvA